VTLEDTLYWRTQRWLRYAGRLGEGVVRRGRDRVRLQDFEVPAVRGR
jgi:hypothetical protein